MRTPISLKSIEDGRESLEIEVELDHSNRLVVLHMLEFDADLIASFLVRVLPDSYGVRVDDAGSERKLSLPRYELVVELAGRRHPTRLQHLSGRTTIRLGDPDAKYLARCYSAIERLLMSLHEVDVDGLVAGIDRYGRPSPNEGSLHLYARARDAAQARAIAQVCAEVEAKFKISICVASDVAPAGAVDQVFAHQAHFAWHRRQLVRRNWEPATRKVGKGRGRSPADRKCARAPSPKPTNARWLRAEELDPLQREGWKRSGQVFSVVHDGVELYPGYQFLMVDGRWQPRPSIALILKALGPVEHPWLLVAWFLSAHPWLMELEGDTVRSLSPEKALARSRDDDVVQAARRSRSGNVI